MGAIGVAIGLRQTAREEVAAPEESPAAIRGASAEATLKEHPAPGAAAEEAMEAAAEAVQPAEPEEGESPEPEPGEAETPEAEEAAPNEVEQALPPTLNMENPFRVKGSKMPTCDQLVSENPVKEATDPIQAASGVWDEARKAIVSGRVQEAHILMCQAVALNPESAALEGLAHHYMRGRSAEQSLVWAEKAEALRPGQLEIANLRGDIYGMMGDTEKAKATWLQALGVPPTETARILSISKDYSVDAARHLRRGDLILAELWYRRAVILNPENLTGLVGLAKTYQRAEMPDYARAFCELSLRVSDVVPEVHVMLGELALADGNKIEAKQRFERALKVRPDFFPARRGLGQVK